MQIRIGTITNVYPEEGKAIVYYADLDSVSQKLPLLTFNNEFSLPSIGDMVVTLHLTSTSQGFILGTYWDSDSVPYQAGIQYKKLLGNEASISFDDNNTKIEAPEIVLKNNSGQITLSDILIMKQKIEQLENLHAQV